MSKVVETILEYLQLQAESTVDLLDTIFSDKSTSYRKARRTLRYGAPEFKTNWAEWYRERQTFYSLLNRLKRDGLIKKHGQRNFTKWTITKQGKDRLKYLVQRKKEYSKLPHKKYPIKQAQNVVIVSFDVPEKERGKRRWLRTHLISFGFRMLQKSVWIGKFSLPEEFIKDLREHRLLAYVHIFSINQQGTIKEVR